MGWPERMESGDKQQLKLFEVCDRRPVRLTH
jgi:hypothetical protein